VNRLEKQETVNELHEVIQGNATFYLVDFKGLTVEAITDLRNRVRQSESSMRVVKNTLLKKASEGTDLAQAEAYMEGPTAMAWSGTDPVALAKVLVAYAKDNPHLKVKAGVVEGEVMDASGVEAVSKLSSLPETRATLAGLLVAPATKLATILQTPAGNMANCLKQRGEQE